ncbi:MAG: hypothetical protein ABSG36_14650 [Acidimicrobiales bacterium]
MAEDRAVSEVLLDYLLYAPLGAAVVAAEELPRLAERGRERFGRQIGAAELIGRLAVAEARRRLLATSVPSDGSMSRPQPRSPFSLATRGPAAAPAPEAPQRPLRSEAHNGVGERSRAGRAPRKDAPAAPEPHELPIPAYDTLAASQVVERLASLTPVELEAVRKHESSTRRRRTVLHRIAQLNAERQSAPG